MCTSKWRVLVLLEAISSTIFQNGHKIMVFGESIYVLKIWNHFILLLAANLNLHLTETGRWFQEHYSPGSCILKYAAGLRISISIPRSLTSIMTAWIRKANSNNHIQYLFLFKEARLFSWKCRYVIKRYVSATNMIFSRPLLFATCQENLGSP